MIQLNLFFRIAKSVRILIVLLVYATSFFSITAQRVISDDFMNSLVETDGERSATEKPIWVGRFSCLLSPDLRLEAFTSSKKNFIAFRSIGVFGIQDSASIEVSFKEGELSLKDHKKIPRYFSMSSKLVVAQHGERRFLVPFGSVHRFCLDIRERKDPTEFYLSDSGRSDLRDAEIVLPDKYKVFAKMPAFKTTVIEVVKEKSSNSYQVVFENRKELQLYNGMELMCDKSELYEVSNVGMKHASAQRVFELDVKPSPVFMQTSR